MYAVKFAGEQSDDEVGLIYLRARYYDAVTGRFLARHPFPGKPEGPLSQMPYAYSRCNPVLYVDRSGKLIPLAVPYMILKEGCLAKSLSSVYKDLQRVDDPTPFTSQAAVDFANRQLRRSMGLLIAELTPIPCVGTILEYLFPDPVYTPGQETDSQTQSVIDPNSGGGSWGGPPSQGK